MTLDLAPVSLPSLLSSLRATAVQLLEQIDAVDFHSPLEPSGWTVLELVTHLTRHDEHYWFANLVAGRATPRTPGTTGWTDPASPAPSAHLGSVPVTKAQACREYLRAVEDSEAVVAGRDLDEPTAWLDPTVPAGHQPRSVGDVLTLAVLEYSIHVGHLEAAVEVLSGRHAELPGPRLELPVRLDWLEGL
ncbi:MAG: DUF664 domain-containing protein [Phycicoccus sp.]